jgi:hypothetical protein
MLNQIINWLTQSTAKSGLEQFINSKNPTNATEVEYWTRHYEDNNTTYWGRGL